jgi:hypothetical protein
MNPQNQLLEQELQEEAIFIYKKFFCQEPDTTLIEWYIRANLHFKIPPSALLKDIIQRDRDLEAAELVFRRKNPHNILTRKIHIIIYLAETDPKNYQTFINTNKKSFLTASTILFFSAIQSVYKLLKGLIFYRKKHV